MTTATPPVDLSRTATYIRIAPGTIVEGFDGDSDVRGRVIRIVPEGLIIERVEPARTLGTQDVFLTTWADGITFREPDLTRSEQPVSGWPATDNPFTKLRRMLYDFNTARYATQEIVTDDKVAWGELDDMDKPVSLADMMDTLTHLADRYDKRVATGAD